MRFELRMAVLLVCLTCTCQQQSAQRHLIVKNEETDRAEKKVLPFGARISYSAEDRSSLLSLPVPVADSVRKVVPLSKSLLPVAPVGSEVVHPRRRKKLRKVKVPKRRTDTSQTVSKDKSFNNSRAVGYRMPAELRNSGNNRVSHPLREFKDSKRRENDKHITSAGQVVTVGTTVSSIEKRHRIEKLQNRQQQQTTYRYGKDQILHPDLHARKILQDQLLNKNVALKPTVENYDSRLSMNKLNRSQENSMQNTPKDDPSTKLIGTDISLRTSDAKNLTKIFNYNHPFKTGENKNASMIMNLNSAPRSFDSSSRKESFETSIRNNFDNIHKTISGPSIPISRNFQFPLGIIPLDIDFNNFSTINNVPQSHLRRNNVSVSYYFYNSSTDGDDFNNIYKPSIVHHAIPEIDNSLRGRTNLTTIHRNPQINNHKLSLVLNPDKKVMSRPDSGPKPGIHPTTNRHQTSSKPFDPSTKPGKVPAVNTHKRSPGFNAEEKVVSSLRSQQNPDSGPKPGIHPTTNRHQTSSKSFNPSTKPGMVHAVSTHKIKPGFNAKEKVVSSLRSQQNPDSGPKTGIHPTTNRHQTSSKPAFSSTKPATVPSIIAHKLSTGFNAEEKVVSRLRSQQNRGSGPHPTQHPTRTPPCRCSWSIAECGCSCGNTSMNYDDFQFLAQKTFRPCDSFSFEISGDQYALPPNFFSGIGRVKDFTLRLSNTTFQYLFDPTPGSSPFRGVSFQRRGLIQISGVNVVRGWNWAALEQLTSTSGAGVDVEIDGCGLAKLSSDFARVAGGDVTNIRISDSGMEMIGSGSFATFDTINRLLLPQNRLRELRRDDLPPEPRHLTEIDLRENQLKSLEPDLFSGMESLRSISLEGNPLMVLDERTFYRVIGRTHVDGLSKIPLLCDCSLRWLKNSTIDSNPVLERNVRGATCRRPPHLRGTPFRDLSVEHLTCSKTQGN